LRVFQTMVVHERDGLLSHPLCQNILSQKWYDVRCLCGQITCMNVC